MGGVVLEKHLQDAEYAQKSDERSSECALDSNINAVAPTATLLSEWKPRQGTVELSEWQQACKGKGKMGEGKCAEGLLQVKLPEKEPG
ncbi:MAG: hypothetical protein SGPRY_001646 [Prymnesium sp.]